MKNRGILRTFKSIFTKRNSFIMYLILVFVCGGIFAVFSNMGNENAVLENDISEQNIIHETEISNIENNTETVPNDVENLSDNSIISEKETIIEEEFDENTVETTVNPNLMVNPIFGPKKIVKSFSMDKLVYNKTLDQWSCHSGVDLGAEIGTDILACMDGTIIEANMDKSMGYFIKIDHGNNLYSTYSNLDNNPIFNVGDEVKKGDIIGHVGKTSVLEKNDDPHIHFELIENDKYINPEPYLP